MLRTLGLMAALALVASPAAASQPAPDDARVLVHQAMDALGGEAPLSNLKVVRLKGLAVRNALEQSVRPGGPWAQEFSDLVETRRFDAPALRDEERRRGYSQSWWTSSSWGAAATLVIQGVALHPSADGKLAPGRSSEADAAQEALALGPERVLFTALSASNLHREPDAEFHGYPHYIVGFNWQGHPVRLFIEPVSHMPVMVEIVRPMPADTFWSVWGDVTTRVTYDQWTLEAGGVHYPRLWLTEGNGQPSHTLSIDGVELNPDVAPDVFAASSDAIDAAAKRRRVIDDIAFPGHAKAVTVTPGVIQVQGAWNVGEVETPRGVYVLEGPLSSAYSAGVIAELKHQGRPILGVITTSDSWPHIGGLRQYVAEGVPIYAVDLNRPILQRLFAAPHRQRPDALALHPRKADVHYVTTPIELGEGDTRMRLIPLRTVTGERQMAVYFPASRVLYTSDLFAVEPDDVWLPGYRDEMSEVVAREHLAVETVFGMHYGPTLWSRVLTLKAPS